VGEADARPATWRSLLADGEYRTLWVAQAVSTVGDQLARVALTILVYEKTRSTFYTAAVIGITYLPWLIGGPFLGGLADRFRRRSIMIGCSMGSAVLIGTMAAPLPLAVLCALLFLAVLLEPLFASARSALLADILSDDRYVLANALGNLTVQTGGVIGFALGGVIVAAIGPQRTLLLDAATFVLVAVLLKLWVADRPGSAMKTHDSALIDWWTRLGAGARLVFRNPRLRALLLLSWLAAFYVVPEGLAAPFVAEFHGDSADIGLVLAAPSAGVVLGGLVISRLVPRARRVALMTPMAALSLAPLVLIGLRPPLPVSMLLLLLAGVGSSYQLVANATYVQSVPAERRGQAYGLATAGLIAGQGLGIFGSGAIASWAGPVPVIVGAGAIGLLALFAITGAGRRVIASSAPSPAVH
jgi:MFS family permease